MYLYLLFILWGIQYLLEPWHKVAYKDITFYCKMVISGVLVIMSCLQLFTYSYSIFELLFHILNVFIVYKGHLYSTSCSIVLLYFPGRFLSFNTENYMYLYDGIEIGLAGILCVLEYYKKTIHGKTRLNIYQQLFISCIVNYEQVESPIINFQEFYHHISKELSDHSLFFIICHYMRKEIIYSAKFYLILIIAQFSVVITLKYYILHRHFHDLVYFIASFVIYRLSVHQTLILNSNDKSSITALLQDITFRKSLASNKYTDLLLFDLDVNVLWSSLLKVIVSFVILMQLDIGYSMNIISILPSLLTIKYSYVRYFLFVLPLVSIYCCQSHIYIAFLLAILFAHSSKDFINEVYKYTITIRDLKKLHQFLLIPNLPYFITYEQSLVDNLLPLLEIDNFKLYKGMNSTLTTDSISTIIIRDTISYTPSIPFMLSTTIKKNVLFYSKYHQYLYQKVVYQSGLHEHLIKFKNKDLTFVTENSPLDLQKCIEIARRLYSKAAINIYESKQDVCGTTTLVITCKKKLMIPQHHSLQTSITIASMYKLIGILSILYCFVKPILSIAFILGFIYFYTLKKLYHTNLTNWTKAHTINDYYTMLGNGLYSIKCYNKEYACIKEFQSKLKRKQQSLYLLTSLKAFIELRFDLFLTIVLVLGLMSYVEVVVVVLLLL